MTDQAGQKIKVTDEGTEKHVGKTPESAKQDGVIAHRPNQDVHQQAIAVAQANDKHPSGIQPAVHESFGITGDLSAKDTGKKHKPSHIDQHNSISHDELLERAAKGDGFARDLAKQLESAKTPADKVRVQDNADRFYHRGEYAEHKAKPSKSAQHQENISESAMQLKALAKHNPALEPVEKLREHADQLPPGPKKEMLTKLSREQAKEFSPEMRDYYQHKEALTNTPDGWLHAGRRIAQLPIDKQLEVIGGWLKVGFEQYSHDEQERVWGSVIGTVQGSGEFLINMAKIADFAAYCIIGDHGRAGKMGEEFGTALGQTIVGGVRLFQAADKYLNDVGFAIGANDDYGKVFRDIQALGQKLNDDWSKLPPREQERIKSKFIAEIAGDGLVGAAGASAIKKAKTFTEILDTVSTEAQVVAKPKVRKAVEAVKDFVNDVRKPPPGGLRPAYAAEGPFDPQVRAKSASKDETKMLMSKADDMGEHGPMHSENGVKGEPVPEKYTPPKWFETELASIQERLSPGEKAFIKEHGIKIKPIRMIADKFPEKGNLGACYDRSENTIYVPEQVLWHGKPVPNYDIEFAFRHEFGHAYSHTKLSYQQVSSLDEFAKAFREDVKYVPPEVLHTLGFDVKSLEGIEFAREEVFADTFAWATGSRSKNPYSQLIKAHFPRSFTAIKEL